MESKAHRVEQEIEQVFGRKYNFEVTIDPQTKSGLKGLPPHVEDRILGIFSKEEIMADPEKVIACLIEAQIPSGPGHHDNNAEDESVSRT